MTVRHVDEARSGHPVRTLWRSMSSHRGELARRRHPRRARLAQRGRPARDVGVVDRHGRGDAAGAHPDGGGGHGAVPGAQPRAVPVRRAPRRARRGVPRAHRAPRRRLLHARAAGADRPVRVRPWRPARPAGRRRRRGPGPPPARDPAVGAGRPGGCRHGRLPRLAAAGRRGSSSACCPSSPSRSRPGWSPGRRDRRRSGWHPPRRSCRAPSCAPSTPRRRSPPSAPVGPQRRASTTSTTA